MQVGTGPPGQSSRLSTDLTSYNDLTEVVPFTINLPDGTSAHTNIIAIAHAARTDLETVTAKVQEHLQQWRMPYGSPRSSRPRPSEICRSLVGAQATIEKIVTELLHQRYLAAFEVRGHFVGIMIVD